MMPSVLYRQKTNVDGDEDAGPTGSDTLFSTLAEIFKNSPASDAKASFCIRYMYVLEDGPHDQ